MFMRLCNINPPESYSTGDPLRLDPMAPLLLQLLKLLLLLLLLVLLLRLLLLRLLLLHRSNISRIDCTLTRRFSSIFLIFTAILSSSVNNFSYKIPQGISNISHPFFLFKRELLN